MRNSALARIAAAATITIAFSVAAQAQSEPKATDKTPAKKQKPAPKPTHKVWTEDNISTVRTQADAVIDAQDRQTVNNAAAAQAEEASEKQPAADPSKPPAKKAPLSQAKSVEDADAKIAWEKRDIQGQEEYIAGLEQRLSSATPEERAHLQQTIEQHKQYIVESRKEMQGLEEQKKEFQNPKKPAAPAPAAQAPAKPATEAPAPAPADSDSATSAESQPPSR